ncbi:glycosyltransferase 87 family protein [Aquimarina pacifica]|uniref:glycosyltransferase 87 family protein n=1 Tax=Aquimarina pacifica TaxID=1296415 RepID=UPI00046F9E34|nr:glycosyltransferase 87 family protein [Aquimarina pacifica]
MYRFSISSLGKFLGKLDESYWFSISLLVLSCSLYWGFAYQVERTDVTLLISVWVSLFALSYASIHRTQTHWKILAVSALIYRIIFFFAVPNLSQDFYRFIWDGRMLIEGLNPYLSLPEVWVTQENIPITQAQELYNGMGQLNGSHYTNYPPISQFCYAIAAIFSGKSIIGSAMVFRTLLILADIGTFFFGKKLLQALDLPKERIFWYILNPFIIIECTGNLHFEGIMVFFIIYSLYLLHKGYWYWAAIILGLSISVKLIPLLFLPLFFQKLVFNTTTNNQLTTTGISKLFRFYSIVLMTVFLTFAPFLSGSFLTNFSSTIRLWFQNFEFNASIYFVIRWIGYQIVGWNIIETTGKIIPLIVIIILLCITFFRKNRDTKQLITAMLLGICIYYFLSTTVHPWYIAVPLSLCIFTKYRFPILWSLTVILSYTAYIHPDFKENLWMVGLEYVLVFALFIWELFKKKPLDMPVLHNM